MPPTQLLISVSVKGTTSILEEGDYVGGAMTLAESTGDLSLSVYSDQGELLENIPLGAQPSGETALPSIATIN